MIIIIFYVVFVKFALLIVMFTVPTPIVRVTTLDTQTVGQSLTLQCEVTTVRGIDSRVDIVWSSDGTVKRTNDTTAVEQDNSQVYMDFYTILQLNTNDKDRVIQCEVVIIVSPPVKASNNITLSVTGKYILANYTGIPTYLIIHSS